jgi:peptidoglycan/LPS O-acetylase OafA/YrhL
LGLIPLAFGPLDFWRRSCPWFIGLFAMGMIAAEVALSGELIPWIAALCGASAVAVATPLIWHFGHEGRYMAPQDILVGMATASFLALCVQPSSIIAAPRALLEMKPIVWLGTFSYSIYLMHTPILAKVRPFTNLLHLSPLPEFIFTMLVTVPIVVAASFAFYLVCERPFIYRRPAPAPVEPEVSLVA